MKEMVMDTWRWSLVTSLSALGAARAWGGEDRASYPPLHRPLGLHLQHRAHDQEFSNGGRVAR